jgi:hypothetical protein
MPPWATDIVNDSASIPGNPIPLVLVSSFIFLHKHSNRVIMFWTGYYARVQ